jgi:hypothetical protein
MVDISNAAEDLFFKLRNRFPRINMGDENGSSTVDPEAARFFNFVYTDKESKRGYGNVTCSIIDNSSLKVYFDTQITENMLPDDKKYWFEFLKELRRMAKGHMLNFDVRDITKDVLSRQDLQYMTKLNPEKKSIKSESIMEGKVLWNRRGKVSEGNLNNVTIHVVHSEKMLENSNNRLLKVDRIYCVNEAGEKFLLPFKSVSGAKAMANHISRGGNPYDPSGQIIGRAVNEMRNLSRFASSTRNKTFEAAEAGQVISAAQQMKESIRNHLMRLSNNSRSFTESLEALTKLLPESEQDITELKGWFTTQAYNETLDNYLGAAAGAYQRLKENAFEITEAPGAVEQKIMNPNFQLILKHDPAMDRLMVSRKYADKKALLNAVLGDIANRTITAKDDDVANFAALMGDLISSEGEAFGQRSNPEYDRDKKLSILLAQKYMKDLAEVMRNPEFAAQVRKDPAARTLMKGKSKRPEEEFEEEIMGMGETHADSKPDIIISIKKKDDGSNDHDVVVKGNDAEGDPKPQLDRKVHGLDNEDATDQMHPDADDKTWNEIEDPEPHHDHADHMEEGTCNMSEGGVHCPVHGVAECMYEEDHEHGDSDKAAALDRVRDRAQSRKDEKKPEKKSEPKSEKKSDDDKSDDNKDHDKSEGSKKKKPDDDGDGVPDWADKKPGKDDNADKKKDDKVDESIKTMLKLAGL